MHPPDPSASTNVRASSPGTRPHARTLKQLLHRQDPLDQLFQALSDPGRRAMVDRLTRGPASVSELAAPLDMTMSAVVQHLHVLESSGLVRSRKVGRVRTCHMVPGSMQTVEEWAASRRTTWERRLERLGEFLDPQEDAST